MGCYGTKLPSKIFILSGKKGCDSEKCMVGNSCCVEWMVTCAMWEKVTVILTQTARLVLYVEQVEVVHKCLGQILNPMTNVA